MAAPFFLLHRARSAALPPGSSSLPASAGPADDVPVAAAALCYLNSTFPHASVSDVRRLGSYMNWSAQTDFVLALQGKSEDKSTDTELIRRRVLCCVPRPAGTPPVNRIKHIGPQGMPRINGQTHPEFTKWLSGKASCSFAEPKDPDAKEILSNPTQRTTDHRCAGSSNRVRDGPRESLANDREFSARATRSRGSTCSIICA